MKRMKDYLLTMCILPCLYSNAQEKITSLPAIPEKGRQTFQQYIESHTVSEMNKDTVIIANVYATIGYSYWDNLFGTMSRSFYVVKQDLVYEGSELKKSNEILYVPVAPAKYERTPAKIDIIKKKIKTNFELNNNNDYFFRNDKFAVEAEMFLGEKKVTFHCLTYPQYYVLDFSQNKQSAEEDLKKKFEQDLHKSLIP